MSEPGPIPSSSPQDLSEEREPTETDNLPIQGGEVSSGQSLGGSAKQKRQKKKGKPRKDGFESFHNVIVESMRETQRLRESNPNFENDLSSRTVFLDAMKDIESVASETIASIKVWTNKNINKAKLDQQAKRGESDASELVDAIGEADHARVEQTGTLAQSQSQKNSLLQDLAWPFAVCGLDVPGGLPRRHDFGPQIHKMKEAVSRAVLSSDLNNAANDIWKFAAGSRDDDENTVGTLDTLQEENNQIRRLGSWGTINTVGTGGTTDTDLNSLESAKAPIEIQFGIEDDDGNTIDPVLLQKAKKHREKRSSRREKLVKFDYPPIKSLRQCPRADPADLPDLFFTEGELDQIEDDRFSTMSTDDIEIVAVSSSAPVEEAPRGRGSGKSSPKSKPSPTFAANTFSKSPITVREPPEHGRKSRGRTSTPYRRRRDEDDEEADFPTHSSKSASATSNNTRLVKGVQIYLRERSTGT